MIELAADVHMIPLFPRYAVNAYLVGTVLIDAGVRSARKKILKALQGRELTAHALTHAHPDHQGASAAVCRERFVPFWVGAGDVEAAESGHVTGTMPDPEGFVARTMERLWAGPGCPVDHALKEDDEVAGFQVLETPGHTPGHVAFCSAPANGHRPSDQRNTPEGERSGGRKPPQGRCLGSRA